MMATFLDLNQSSEKNSDAATGGSQAPVSMPENGHAMPEPQPQAYAQQAFQMAETYQSYGHQAQEWQHGPEDESAQPMTGTNAPAQEDDVAPSVVTQEQADEMLRRHILWLDTHGAEGKRVNFRNADLRNVRLDGANLTQASLRGAILTHADMTRVATMQEADFTEAVLNGANFSGTNLRRANFASVQAEGANFSSAVMTSANGLSANFTLAQFRHSDLTHINLRQANMTAADFSDTDLTEANCRSANLSGAKFHRAILVNADMRHTHCEGADFAGANMQQTQFKDASFEGVSFTNANFAEALEISQQYQSAGFHQEKEKIVQQRQEVSAMSEIYTNYAEEDRKTIMRLLKVKRTLKTLFIVWGVVMLAIMAVTAMIALSIPFDQLRIGELVTMGVGLSIITLLFFTTVRKTKAAVNILEAHVTVRERQLMKAE